MEENLLPSVKSTQRNIFRPPPTQIPGTRHVHDPYDAFKLFVSDKMVDDIVRNTNLYGKNTYKSTSGN